MRKLPAVAQEERRRQVIGLRQAGMTYDEIAAQVGLSATEVFNICQRYAERGGAGLKSGPQICATVIRYRTTRVGVCQRSCPVPH